MEMSNGLPTDSWLPQRHVFFFCLLHEKLGKELDTPFGEWPRFLVMYSIQLARLNMEAGKNTGRYHARCKGGLRLDKMSILCTWFQEI